MSPRPWDPPAGDDGGAALAVRWRRLRMFATPAVDPELPASEPLAVFGRRVRDAAFSHAGRQVDAALVAEAERWLAELGLAGEFEEWAARLDAAIHG